MVKTDELTQIVSKVISKLEREYLFYVPVGVSGRHIHVSQKDLDILFGYSSSLTKLKDLKQPGEFASLETLTVSGKKGSFENVRILGPVRESTQVEISVTDSIKLGVEANVCESGRLLNAGMITITNPITGATINRKAAIAALRHIHMSPEHAERLGIKDRETVSVEIKSGRPIIFNDVLIRVSAGFVPEMHIDTDEANAGGIINGMYGKILLEMGKV